jgi:hypothetical protein
MTSDPAHSAQKQPTSDSSPTENAPPKPGLHPPPDATQEAESPKRERRTIDVGVATMIGSIGGAVILAVSGILGVIIGRGSVATPAGERPPISSPLNFSLNSPASIPWCSDLTGAGKIPRGYSLAIFDAAEHVPPYYHFDGFASQTSSDAWSLAPVYIGTRKEAGLQDSIAGVLVTASTAAFVNSILAGPPHGNAFWVTNTLPPGIRRIYLKITRTSDTTQCAGNSG